MAAPKNGISVWVRSMNKVSGAVFEQQIKADRPATTHFRSLGLHGNNRATAAAHGSIQGSNAKPHFCFGRFTSLGDP
jgi:hypothetical protein